jgi:hypothetical protein
MAFDKFKSTTKSALLPLIAALMIAVTTACGSPATNPPTEALDGTESLLATNQAGDSASADEVSMTPTLNQTPVGLNLPNSTSSSDGALMVGYPDGWFGQAQGGMVTVSNQGEASEVTDLQTMQAGQAVITLSLIPREQFEQTGMSLSEMAETLAETLTTTANAEGATFGDPAEGEINGLPSVTLTGTTTTGGTPMDMQIILVDRENDNVIVQAILLTANGESEGFEGTAQEIVGSVRVDSEIVGTEEADLNAVDVGTDEIEANTTVTITATRDALGGTSEAATPSASPPAQ